MATDFQNIDDLLGKYLSGEASAEESATVKLWVSLSAENQRYFRQLKTIFEKAATVKEYPSFDTDAAWHKVKDSLIKKEPGRVISMPPSRDAYSRYWRVAAAVLVVVAAALYYFANTPSGSTATEVELVAEKKAVADTLPDGSGIFLNKETKVAYAYDRKTRTHEVKLRGEAYFNIQSSKREDFIVDAGGVYIRDIGTSFNVKAYPGSDLVEVLVEEGEIIFFTKDNPGVRLKESGKAVYNKVTGEFRIENPDPNITAYKTRFFVFSPSDLGTMAEELNSVYDVKLVVPPHLRSCSMTVSFRDESITEIASVIAETLGLTIKEEPGRIIFEGKGCE